MIEACSEIDESAGNLAEQFLSLFSEGSAKTYRCNLLVFARCATGTNSLVALDAYVRSLKRGELDLRREIEKFYISQKGYAPVTVINRMSLVRSFLEECGLALPDRFWERLRGRRVKGRAKPVTADRPPSQEEMRLLIQYLPVHGRALVLVLLSGGLRVGEALKLRLGDVALDTDPAEVRVCGADTKTQRSRVVFISREAAEAVRAWLKVRGDYLRSAAGRSWKHPKPLNTDRLFPFEYSTALSMFNGALRKAGLDDRDMGTKKRIRIRHLHTLRKYFKTTFVTATRLEDVPEALMGHEGGVEMAYNRYSFEQIARFFKEAESALSVMSDRAEAEKLKKAVEAERCETQRMIASLITENERLRSGYEEVSKREAENRELLERIMRHLPGFELEITGLDSLQEKKQEKEK